MLKTRAGRLAEGGVMIALATILSFIKIYEAPFGGSITLASMLPIVFFAYRNGAKWGLFAGFVHGVIQLLFGVGAMATWGLSPAVFAGSILLDYLLAFTVLGVVGFFTRVRFGLYIGTALAFFLRFVCHFVSGVILFASWTPEGMTPAVYSTLYNGGYMLPELVITLVALAAGYGSFRLYGILKEKNAPNG